MSERDRYQFCEGTLNAVTLFCCGLDWGLGPRETAAWNLAEVHDDEQWHGAMS